MCRVGIGLYGLQPAETTAPRIQLDPVMSVRGRVTRAIYPNVGDGVGYGLTWRVPKQNMQVATVPIGYADGLSRQLSGRVSFLLRGVRVPVVGRICMDMCMVDVTQVPEARVGDQVTVLGDGKDGAPSACDLAGQRGDHRL